MKRGSTPRPAPSSRRHETSRTHVDRREFAVTTVAGVLATPLLARAQQSARLPRIGVLRWTSPPDTFFQTGFSQALKEIGYTDGRSIVVEWRWTDGRSDVAARHAAELVQLAVDVIVASPTPAAHAAQRATRTIPIVLSGVADPVGSGLVASLARPGGNVTGVSLNLPAVAGKRLGILREAVPTLASAGFLGSASDPATRLFVRNTEEAAKQLGVRIHVVLVESAREFESAFALLAKERVCAVVVQPIFVSPRERVMITDLAFRHRLPTISDLRGFADVGGLISYGPSQLEQYRRVAAYVDRLLKGAKAAELPIEEPTTFDLVINLKTARMLGVTISPSLLARADHVIE
jgi:putative tryptophan/tyrosine transport system substrate-binding protein